MKSVFLFLVLFLAGVPAVAEPVRVSAGEHTRFTRLILDFEAPLEWKTQRRGNTYRLKFSSVSPVDFDLSRVFRLIDRKRVADVRAVGGSVIEIDLACDCEVRPTLTRGGALVVDVHEMKADLPEPQASVVLPPTPMDNETAPDMPAVDLRMRERDSPVALPDQGTAGMSEAPQTSRLPVSGVPEAGGVAVELVGRALSRAAAQGLVSADTDVPDRGGQLTLRQLRTLEDRLNLSVTTSFDRATLPATDGLPPTSAGVQCVGDRAVDVSGWGDVADTASLGRLRGMAVAEDGSVDADGARKLARYYLHLGFGAEARIAAQYMPSSQDRDIVEALADVMDEGRADASVLIGQAACRGSISLWAVLARPLDDASAPNTVNPALAAFSALPSHLRTHLGPLLSKRLHAAGFSEEARTAINAVTRGGIRTEESELATARLELDGTNAEAARGVLSDLSNSTNLTAAAALLELLNDAQARGMAPNPAWVDDAPTLVGALEGTEIAERLNVAGLRGLIALGRFDEFRAALVAETPGLTESVRQELARTALRTATDRAADEALVTSEIGLAKIVGPDALPRDLRGALAERLHDIGLSQRASAYLEPKPQSAQELSIAVRVHLALGRIETALEMLRNSPLDSPSALRASSLAAAGQDRSAIDAYLSAGDKEGAIAAALRIADWSWLAENAEGTVASAARALTAPLSYEDGEAETPNGTLIADSRARRDHVRGLLDLTRPTADPPAFTN